MNLLILGANSDVAWATAKVFAQHTGAALTLASRDMEMLEKKVDDLRARFDGSAQAVPFDALDFASHEDFYANLTPRPDGVIVAFGIMQNQQTAQDDFGTAQEIIDSNFTGAASILEIIASDFQKRRAGFIVGISSVAGERGRQSNYVYGAAKAAFTTYLSGLRNRLSKFNVQVITVLPGFIQTKMTADLNLPGPLTASPKQVAQDIYTAYQKSRDTIYTRWFWRWIMVIIKCIPETVFKRMSL